MTTKTGLWVGTSFKMNKTLAEALDFAEALATAGTRPTWRFAFWVHIGNLIGIHCHSGLRSRDLVSIYALLWLYAVDRSPGA